MCSGSGLLLQGEKKKFWFTAAGGGRGEKKNPVEIESLTLDFHLGGMFVNNLLVLKKKKNAKQIEF